MTLATRWQSKFELHARTILELQVDAKLKSAGVSAMICGDVDAKCIASKALRMRCWGRTRTPSSHSGQRGAAVGGTSSGGCRASGEHRSGKRIRAARV